jgi:hypothetical protein
MDHSRSRPELPGSTPSPAPMGMSSVYQGTALPRFEEAYLAERAKKKSLTPAQMAQTGNMSLNTFGATQQRKSQQALITKIVGRLPYNVREQVEAIFNMSMDTAEAATKQLETYRREILNLKKEVNMKHEQTLLAERKASAVQQQMIAIVAANDMYKEDVDLKTNFHLRNKHILGKVSSTNKMLTRSLEALQGSTPTPNTMQPNHSLLRSTSAESGSNPRITLTPIPMEGGAVSIANMIDDGDGGENNTTRPATGTDFALNTLAPIQPPAGASGPLEKLRESLLRVTREHDKSTKQSKNFERELHSVKKALKEKDILCRQLKSELDELKSIKSDASPDMAVFVQTATNNAPTTDDKPNSAGSDGSDKATSHVVTSQYIPRVKHFGKIDDRFKALLKREALDPLDGIQTMRRVLEFCAKAPQCVNAIDVAHYAVSREMTKIFDVEIACVFLKDDALNECYKLDMIKKVTLRSSEYETLSPLEYRGRGEPNAQTSVMWETIRTGHVARLNTLHGRTSTNFNRIVDSVPGTVAKRLMVIPLKNGLTGKVMGCLSMINKLNPADAFSEADELLATVLVEQIATHMTNCFVHEQALNSANVYRRTLESAVTLHQVIPDQESAVAEREFTPGQLIKQMEEVSRTSLKCQKTRAFLLSDHFPGLDPGLLIMGNDERKMTSGAVANDSDYKTTNALSSIAGQVAVTYHPECVFSSDVQPKWGVEFCDSSRLNPYVDLKLDANTKAIITLPVIDSNGTIYGVIQFSPSPNSPSFDLDEKFVSNVEAGNRIFFSQAAQWLCYQMIGPIKHLIKYIGRQVVPPLFEPLEYYRRQLEFINLERLSDFVESHSDHFKEKSDLASAAQALSAVAAASISRAATPAVSAAVNASIETLKSDLQAAKAEAETNVAKARSAEAGTAQAEQRIEEAKVAHEKLLAEFKELQASQEELVRQVAVVSEARQATPHVVISKPPIPQVSDNVNNDETSKILLLEQQLEVQADLMKQTIDVHEKQLKLKDVEIAQHVEQHAAKDAVIAKHTKTNSQLTEQLVKMADDSLKNISFNAPPTVQTDANDAPPSSESVAEAIDNVQNDLFALAAGESNPSTRPQSKENSRPLSREKPLSAKPPPTLPPGSKPGSAGNTGVSTVHVEGQIPGLNDSQGSTSDWQELHDDQGHVYYYNTVTHVTSWELPAETAGGFSSSTDAFVGVTFGDWSQMFDQAGHEYWVNNVSGESVWELPEGVKNSVSEEQLSSRPTSSNVVAAAGDYQIEL